MDQEMLKTMRASFRDHKDRLGAEFLGGTKIERFNALVRMGLWHLLSYSYIVICETVMWLTNNRTAWGGRPQHSLPAADLDRTDAAMAAIKLCRKAFLDCVLSQISYHSSKHPLAESYCLLFFPWSNQIYSCFRFFAHAVPSTGNISPVIFVSLVSLLHLSPSSNTTFQEGLFFSYIILC